MSNPVDLTNLREMTDGDAELEAALFDEFLRAGDECVATLVASNNPPGNSAAWRSAAHALKGTALNLGANHLGALCKQAQEEYEKPIDQKTVLLEQIKAALEEVKVFLKTVRT